MTIYEIKHLTAESSPYFFNKKTMKFFGQTMKSFKVKKLTETKYLISAKNKFNGLTERIFDSETNKLLLINR